MKYNANEVISALCRNSVAAEELAESRADLRHGIEQAPELHLVE